jgi:hypothetical protein
MQDEDEKVNFTIDPHKAPVYQVDGYLISSNNHTVIFSFAQSMLGNQQNVIARVAMSTKQAKEFLEKLNDHIEKFEV